FGVDTAGIDWIPEVQVESANAYSPVSRSIFNRTMRELALDCSRFVFVDFGCGKGKTLLMAAESPFKQVIGIEISTKLAQIAEDNIRVYTGERKCSDSRVVCADARQYVLPSEPAVVFFYDPFKLEAMTTVLENIRRSLIATPREVYVVYVEASWRSLLDDAPFLVPLKQDRWYSLYKALS
ncbi:MAG: class I SAM-dependent methyltransferase, partial [Planctomycetia bacterium]|nr:class I SAM-dependent methyltransferase [Planctomycetia bacterium]